MWRNPVLIFPLAVLVNTYGMTALLLVMGLSGRLEIAAEIGLVQAATLALFYAFSANGRNLVLAAKTPGIAEQLMRVRLALVLPLAAGVFLLSLPAVSSDAFLVIVLIIRRACEWLGELGLASQERRGNVRYTRVVVGVDSLLLMTCMLGILVFNWVPAYAALPWALAPFLALRGVGQAQGVARALSLRTLLPNLGSSAVVGLSVYVFRVSIALLTDKPTTGALFTAFAFGGLLPTVLGQALAPTIVFQGGLARWKFRVASIAALMGLCGGSLMLVALHLPMLLRAVGWSPLFGLAVGLSMMGGAVMVIASVERARLVQQGHADGVFGADMLANILIALCVPFVYFLGSVWALAGLYLLSACLGLLFLWRASPGENADRRLADRALGCLAALLVVPVFFQIDGNLFDATEMVFDPTGRIRELPLPLSLLFLFLGIALLGRYTNAVKALTVVFLSACFLVLTSFALTANQPLQIGAKLVLVGQFMLPMFGLVLGELFGATRSGSLFERVVLVVLTTVVAAQLLASWMNGGSILTPHVFFFSIYQHLQYFPIIVAALGSSALIGLWRRWPQGRLWLVAFWLLCLLHGMASHSALAVAMLLTSGVVCFHLPRFGIVLLVIGVGVALWFGVEALWVRDGIQRTGIWQFHIDGILASGESVFLGHVAPPDRARYPSAYNYWIDLVYNFGLLAAVPLLWLLGDTLRRLYRQRSVLPSQSLLMGVGFAFGCLMVDNLLRVGMRQPYSGIITFFIWGLLMARLQTAERGQA